MAETTQAGMPIDQVSPDYSDSEEILEERAVRPDSNPGPGRLKLHPPVVDRPSLPSRDSAFNTRYRGGKVNAEACLSDVERSSANTELGSVNIIDRSWVNAERASASDRYSASDQYSAKGGTAHTRDSAASVTRTLKAGQMPGGQVAGGGGSQVASDTVAPVIDAQSSAFTKHKSSESPQLFGIPHILGSPLRGRCLRPPQRAHGKQTRNSCPTLPICSLDRTSPLPTRPWLRNYTGYLTPVPGHPEVASQSARSTPSRVTPARNYIGGIEKGLPARHSVGSIEKGSNARNPTVCHFTNTKPPHSSFSTVLDRLHGGLPGSPTSSENPLKAQRLRRRHDADSHDHLVALLRGFGSANLLGLDHIARKGDRGLDEQTSRINKEGSVRSSSNAVSHRHSSSSTHSFPNPLSHRHSHRSDPSNITHRNSTATVASPNASPRRSLSRIPSGCPLDEDSCTSLPTGYLGQQASSTCPTPFSDYSAVPFSDNHLMELILQAPHLGGSNLRNLRQRRHGLRSTLSAATAASSTIPTAHTQNTPGTGAMSARKAARPVTIYGDDRAGCQEGILGASPLKSPFSGFEIQEVEGHAHSSAPQPSRVNRSLHEGGQGVEYAVEYGRVEQLAFSNADTSLPQALNTVNEETEQQAQSDLTKRKQPKFLSFLTACFAPRS